MKPFAIGSDKAGRFGPKALRAFASAGLPVGLQVNAATADTPAEILLYDEIGFWGISGKDFVAALAEAGAGPITVRINSPGGEVFDGMAIYNALRAHKGGVTIQVDGIAASAASYIAMAGGSVVMGEQSMMMIYNAWTIAWGNQFALDQARELLAKIDGQQVAMFAEKTGKPADQIAAWLKEETYFTAQEALAEGFADSIAAAPKKEKASAPTSPTAVADPPPTAQADPPPAADPGEKIRLRARLALAR